MNNKNNLETNKQQTSIPVFDTLRFATNLEQQGFERKQAKCLTDGLVEVLSILVGERLINKQELTQYITKKTAWGYLVICGIFFVTCTEFIDHFVSIMQHFK